MVLGLEKAIDIVEMEEEEQDQQRPPPQPSPHPKRPTPRRTPQNYQNITDGKGLLAGDEEGGDDLSEIQHVRPSTGKGREEAGGTSRGPPGRAGNGRPSSRNTKLREKSKKRR